jgi:murein tripeptide amidase MpaA
MKSTLCILTLFVCLFNGLLYSQIRQSFPTQQEAVEYYLNVKGELYFQFDIAEKRTIKELTRIISIDRVDRNGNGCTVFAYANRDEINQFQKRGIAFTVLPHPGDVTDVRMSANLDTIIQWNIYPTYEGYVNLMNYYAAQYPNLCEIVDAGTSVQGRHILFAKITNSFSEVQNRPRVMLTSSMHGDETAGYVMMLHLIDTLLRGRSQSALIGRLTDQCEIWINPLANPDGTYWGGNHTVGGARRGNANNKDLNRNFPDPEDGIYPTGPWQPETVVMMNIAEAYQFTLSVNFHGGAEVFNFPWDTWERFHPDDNWFIHIAKQYVDTVHVYSPSTYMADFDNYYPYYPGIVNGYAWYEVIGGRQDYMNFYQHCAEVTIELSNTKNIPTSQILPMWNYNNKALLRFIEQSLYGIKGTVKDSSHDNPVAATITVIGKDIMDSTYVRTDSTTGAFHRMIQTGTHSLLVRAPGYYPLILDSIYAKNDSATFLNIMLNPLPSIAVEEKEKNSFQLFGNFPNPFNPSTEIRYELAGNSHVTLKVYNILGQEVITLTDQFHDAGAYRVRWDGKNSHGKIVSGGIYIYRLEAISGIKKFTYSRKMVLMK